MKVDFNGRLDIKTLFLLCLQTSRSHSWTWNMPDPKYKTPVLPLPDSIHAGQHTKNLPGESRPDDYHTRTDSFTLRGFSPD